MSDIKSYQRLLAVQALYEFTINKRGIDDSFDEFVKELNFNCSREKALRISKKNSAIIDF